MKVTKEPFGEVGNKPVQLFTLTNDNGVEVSCINYGCTITKILTQNKEGNLENIVLGYDSLDEYVEHSPFFGCVVGRVAGRIGGAAFDLNGKTYKLAKNENDNHLHGGLKGFDKVVWDATPIEHEGGVGVHFSYISPDGEEGYPGTVEMEVTYTLNNRNEFQIEYKGTTDETTLLNVTNHSYFNLSGDLKKDILDHALTLKSDQFLELKDDLMPSGEFTDVEGTSFDFRSGREIKTGLDSEHPQNKLVGGGYDHPFVLSENQNEEIVLEDKESGRKLTIETDQVGVVVYTSNMLPEEGTVYGVPQRKYLGICLETQGLPDAIHHPHFPSSVLEKGEQYKAVTKYTFGII